MRQREGGKLLAAHPRSGQDVGHVKETQDMDEQFVGHIVEGGSPLPRDARVWDAMTVVLREVGPSRGSGAKVESVWRRLRDVARVL
jgi:hypothetical protein